MVDEIVNFVKRVQVPNTLNFIRLQCERRIISNQELILADLVVVEKFGEHEQKGKGLIDEILQTIVAGIPLLISVPEAALPAWQERTGDLGDVLPFTEAAFWQWWQSQTGQPDLID